MIIRKVPIEQLNPAPYNPRKDLKPGDAEFEKIKASISQLGYIDPVIWNDQTGNVVGGHQRLKVLIELGHAEIDCVVVNFDLLTEKQANIALNKISGEWDDEKLAELLNELKLEDIDLNITGFDAAEIDNLFKDMVNDGITEDDYDEPLPENPISKQGDVWLLGRHRLVCGDSTNLETYKLLMDGKKANLVVTDPPYNVAYEGIAGTIQNDNMDDKKFYEFLLNAYKGMFDSLADGAPIYVFHADKETVNFRTAFKEAGFFCHQTCIWVKNTFAMGRCDFQYCHEPILYGWKPTKGHKFYGDRNQKTTWDFDKPTKSEHHPTMKPIALIAYPIMQSSLTNSIVLDPFGGSGSTLLACEQTDRICYTTEFDEKYADVIVNRFYQYSLEHKNSDEAGSDIYLIRDNNKIKYSEIGGRING